ncbi:hypothetical protein PIB30_062379 [Stylosanthes scabra]|uniref:CCHC-type domain-containing protein n=1 Tax=Stylosanthes scabra TaxID=79078 RepID=A0ABU6VKV8_9FABA|nr:hypothetical protein [Stylosanthes scabra]
MNDVGKTISRIQRRGEKTPNINPDNIFVADPLVVKSKGAPKKHTKYKQKRKCAKCGASGHYQKNCSKNFDAVQSDPKGNDKNVNDSSDNDMPVKRKRHSSEKNEEPKIGRNLRGGSGSDVCHNGEEFVKEQDTNSSTANLSKKEYAARPLQISEDYSSLALYVGSNTLSINYHGVPPYGSTPFEGASISLGDPFFRGPAHQYNYAIPLSAGIPYRPHYSSRPTPSSRNSINNWHDPLAGRVVEQIPISHRHGEGMPIGFRAMGPRMGFFF